MNYFGVEGYRFLISMVNPGRNTIFIVERKVQKRFTGRD